MAENADALSDEQIIELIELHKLQSVKDCEVWDIVTAWYSSELKTKVEGGGEQADSWSQNFLFATTDTIAASVVPNKPTVGLKPRREDFRGPAKALEALSNWAIEKSDAEDICWDLATDSVKYGQGLMKASWDFGDRDPVFEHVENKRLWYDVTAKTWDSLRYVIEVTTISQAELKRRTRKGEPDVDPETKETIITKALYKRKVVKQLKSSTYPDFLKSKYDHESKELKTKLRDIYETVVIYEVYDLVGEKFHHFAEGIDEPLYSGELPYAFQPNPFYLMRFTPNKKDVRGLSDAKLLSSLQQALNELDTLEFRHALAQIPQTFVQTSLLTNAAEFMEMLEKPAVPGGCIPVKAGNTVPISQIVYTPPPPPIGNSLHVMRQRVLDSISHLLGLPGYTRGQGTDKLATNAMLADGFLQTRQGRRQRAVFKAVKWMAEVSLKLYSEHLKADDTKWLRHAGDRVPLVVNREIAAMNIIVQAQGEMNQLLDFTVSVYAGSEDNKATQLGNMLAHSASIMAGIQAGHIPPDKFYTTLLELIGLEQLIPPDPVGTVPAVDPAAQAPNGQQGGQITPPRREQEVASTGPKGAMPSPVGTGGPGIGLPSGAQ